MEAFMNHSIVNKVLFPVPERTYTTKSFGPGEFFWVHPPRVRRPSLVSRIACSFGAVEDNGGDEADREMGAIGHEHSLPCVLVRCPREASRLLIYSHGNGEDLGCSYELFELMAETLGVHVLAYEYPGYGLADGTATEAHVARAARMVYAFVRRRLAWPAESIILFGRSVGSGPTLRMALDCMPGGIVLLSAFTSVCDVTAHLFGSFAAAVVSDRFVNRELMPKVTCPTLLIHGQADTLIPHEHSVRLHDLCGAQRKEVLLPTDMDHNCFRYDDDIHAPIARFFGLPAPPSASLPPLELPAECYVAPVPPAGWFASSAAQKSADDR